MTGGNLSLVFPTRSGTNRPAQSQRIRLEACDLGFKKNWDCTNHAVEAKELILLKVSHDCTVSRE